MDKGVTGLPTPDKAGKVAISPSQCQCYQTKQINKHNLYKHDNIAEFTSEIQNSLYKKLLL